MKKISILITSYNLADYIDNAIASVIQQKQPCAWEVLIGDDGSTDDTIIHIKNWITKFPENIKVFQWSQGNSHTLNGFRSAANRAKLLEKATGDYIAFLDGDDSWIGTDKLLKQFAILEDPLYSSCSCCGHNIYKVDYKNNTRKEIVDKKIPQKIFTKEEYYKTCMYVHTNTILFRSKCKDLLLNSLNRRFINDIHITFCLFQYGGMAYIPDTLANYNFTGLGLWTGANNVYSRFRNVQLYDIESHIDPNIEHILFDCFYSNMAMVMRKYKKKDIPIVKPLVEDIDPFIFKSTITLYKLENLSVADIFNKLKLFMRIMCAYMTQVPSRLLKK